MPLPASHVELLEKLDAAYQKFDAEFDDISEYDSQIKHLEGKVSPADLIAYQIGWGECLLRWEATEKSGQQPDMPATGYKWNELGPLADSFYDAWRETELAAMRAEFSRLLGRLREWIESLDESELFTVGTRQWAGDKWPLAKWIQVNTIAPYISARTKIRRWKKTRPDA